MRFTAIQLRSHDVRLDDLSPGMNVVFASAADQRRLLPMAVRATIFVGHAEEGPDCRLALQTNWGGFHLQYNGADGTVQATDSQGHDRTHWLRQKLGSLTTEAAFVAVYTPRWGDPAALDTLACVLCGDGLSGKRLAAFESLLRDLENTRSWRERDQQLERLKTRQSQIEGELEQARQSVAAQQKHSVEQFDTQIHDCTRRLVRLQKTIARVEQHLSLQHNQAQNAKSKMALQNRLQHIQQHSQRLQVVVHDLRIRSQRLRERLSTEDGKTTSRSMSPQKRRLLVKKYEKVVRCQTALHEQLGTLLEREKRVQSRLEHIAAQSARQSQRLTLVKRLRRLQNRLQNCRDELKVLEARRAASLAHEVKRGTSKSPTTPRVRELQSELAQVRARLARWSVEEHREAEAVLSQLRKFFAERRTPAVLNNAAQILTQLSDGALVAIRAGSQGRELIVEHSDGRAVSCDVLSRAERVQVQLSLCLAAASSAAARGANFPVILNDVTRHIDPAHLRSVIEILRNHGRISGQVILLTSQPHVATLCRSLGASSYNLDPLSAAQPAGAALDAPVVPVRETNWDCEEFPGELRDRIRSTANAAHATWAPSAVKLAVHTGHNDDERHGHERNGHVHGSVDRSGADHNCADHNCADHNCADHNCADHNCADHSGSDHGGSDHGEADETLRVSGHYLELCDRVTEVPFLSRRIAQALEKECVYTVANLLHADAGQLAMRLADHHLSASAVRDWQSQARLMCTVRRLRGYDAKILTACGVTTAEQLADIRPHELYNMIQAFVATPEGSRIIRSGADHEVARLTQWIRSLQRTRQNHEASNGHAQQVQARVVNGDESGRENQKPERKSTKKKATTKSTGSQQRQVKKQATEKPNVIPMRFHLDVTSHVEAAPAIGPAMAKRLEKIGISTVGQLLTATPEEVSKALKNQRVSAMTVRQWQRQASLVCRVPELRGHDAQILVACGVETPERLAAMKSADLAELVLPFVKTKQGRRVLRNGKEPDVQEITQWIQWARCARQLAAA